MIQLMGNKNNPSLCIPCTGQHQQPSSQQAHCACCTKKSLGDKCACTDCSDCVSQTTLQQLKHGMYVCTVAYSRPTSPASWPEPSLLDCKAYCLVKPATNTTARKQGGTNTQLPQTGDRCCNTTRTPQIKQHKSPAGSCAVISSPVNDGGRKTQTKQPHTVHCHNRVCTGSTGTAFAQQHIAVAGRKRHTCTRSMVRLCVSVGRGEENQPRFPKRGRCGWCIKPARAAYSAVLAL